MGVTFAQTWYDFYTWPFGASSGSYGYFHTGGNNAVLDYFSDSPSVNDVFTFSVPEPFCGVKFEVGTAMDGAPVIVWEYEKYLNTWVTLRVENGDAITKLGTQVIRFTPPSDWSAFALHAIPGYRIRMRLTSVGGVTEGGANATNKIQRLHYSFDVTGTGQTMANVYAHDLATAFIVLTAATPAASLTPIECPFKKSGIVGKLDVVLAGCTVGGGDTVVLTGIDFDGAALVETIDVSGNGNTTYTTVNCFKDVTDIACNGFNDGTIQLQTKKLGLILREGISHGYQYNLYTNLIIGDNSIETAFSASRETWCFLYVSTKFCVYGADSTLTMGSYDSTGNVTQAYNDCTVLFANIAGRTASGASGSIYLPRYRLNYYGTVYWYGTHFLSSTISSGLHLTMGIGTFYGKNVRFDVASGSGMVWDGTWTNLDGFWVRKIHAGYGFPSFSGTPRGVVLHANNSLYNSRVSVTFQDCEFEGFTQVNNLDVVRYLKFIDCPNLDDTDITNVNTSGQNGDGIYLQKTFNLEVIDANGDGIGSVTVTMNDEGGVEVFSVSTDGNGDIVEQIVTWQKGTWTAGQTGITWTNYSPHTVTISKAGYTTRELIYDMDRAREEIEMLGGAAPHGREYRRRRVPGEVSILDEY